MLSQEKNLQQKRKRTISMGRLATLSRYQKEQEAVLQEYMAWAEAQYQEQQRKFIEVWQTALANGQNPEADKTYSMMRFVKSHNAQIGFIVKANKVQCTFTTERGITKGFGDRIATAFLSMMQTFVAKHCSTSKSVAV